MVVTQHLRHDGPVVSNIFLKKRPHGAYRACFTLTRADTVQVEIVDASGDPVRVLLPAQSLRGGSEKTDAHCYTWNGDDDSGAPVPAGTYYLRFHLEDAGRTATSGEHVVVAAGGGAG